MQSQSWSGVHVVHGIVRSSEPWLLEASGEVGLLRNLEVAYPKLEDVGCRVGIGVATGADNVFIRPMAELDVEPERTLPLVLAADLDGAEVTWSGTGLLNPYEPDGSLADLDQYPRFAAYIRAHEARLRKRHTAKQNPTRWYKTIDRVWTGLTTQPKLLIPDIKGAATVAYDPGQFYPHHNLYYVVAGADSWDLRALQAVLRSRIAEFFVTMYCVPDDLKQQLKDVAAADRSECDIVSAKAYQLSQKEMALIRSATSGTE